MGGLPRRANLRHRTPVRTGDGRRRSGNHLAPHATGQTPAGRGCHAHFPGGRLERDHAVGSRLGRPRPGRQARRASNPGDRPAPKGDRGELARKRFLTKPLSPKLTVAEVRLLMPGPPGRRTSREGTTVGTGARSGTTPRPAITCGKPPCSPAGGFVSRKQDRRRS